METVAPATPKKSTIDLMTWPIMTLDESAAFTTDNYIGASYKFDSGTKVAIRQLFHTTDSCTNKTIMGDTYLEASRGGVELPFGGLTLTSIGRLYLPTGRDSIDRGQIAQMRGYFGVSKLVTTPFTISYYANPRMFLQSRDVVVLADGSAKATPDYKFIQWVDFTYDINSWLTLEMSVAQVNEWARSDSSLGVGRNRAESAELITSVYVKPMTNLIIQTFLDQIHYTNRGGAPKGILPVSLFNKAETTLNMIIDYKI